MPVALVSRGQAFMLQGKFDSALNEFAALLKDMLSLDPLVHLQDPEGLYYLGEALFQMRDYAGARGYLPWALNIEPEMRDADIILTRVGDT